MDNAWGCDIHTNTHTPDRMWKPGRWPIYSHSYTPTARLGAHKTQWRPPMGFIPINIYSMLVHTVCSAHTHILLHPFSHVNTFFSWIIFSSFFFRNINRDKCCRQYATDYSFHFLVFGASFVPYRYCWCSCCCCYCCCRRGWQYIKYLPYIIVWNRLHLLNGTLFGCTGWAAMWASVCVCVRLPACFGLWIGNRSGR